MHSLRPVPRTITSYSSSMADYYYTNSSIDSNVKKKTQDNNQGSVTMQEWFDEDREGERQRSFVNVVCMWERFGTSL